MPAKKNGRKRRKKYTKGFVILNFIIAIIKKENEIPIKKIIFAITLNNSAGFFFLIL